MVPTVRVQQAAFDPGAEMAALLAGRTDVGGIGCFVGTVRATDGVRALVLEHYDAMTERALATIAQEAAWRWPLLGCTVVHRVGRMLPGEAIVLVLAASAHRAAALDATSFLIDWLKTKAPFWKQEELVDGTSRWVEPRATDDDAATRWG